MKTILRRTAYNAFALFLLPIFIPGVKIYGGLATYIIGGFVFSLISLIIKPALHFITMPINFATFGSFSFVINVILLYILTVFVTPITIHSFNFAGLNYAGFVIPKTHVNTFLSYVVTALTLSLLETFLSWITNE